MPQRSRLSLEDIAEWDNLACAFALAAQGKSRRPDVQAFAAELDRNLAELGEQIRGARFPTPQYNAFQIFDPKPRAIHAPCFRDRVLHHALMRLAGPVIDRSLVHDTYACRKGKGALAAVHRAQHHLRRFDFYVKVDIRKYFASIPHEALLSQLKRRFKDDGLLQLFSHILEGFGDPETGLPIGALTSQHLANLYLSPLDRFLLEHAGAQGLVRYMDDVVAWAEDKDRARRLLEAIEGFVPRQLGLTLHPRRFVQRSAQGLSFLGFRIYPHRLWPSRRRQRRYRLARARWEAAYAACDIDAAALQRGYASAEAILLPTNARLVRKRDLAWREAVDA